LLLWSSTVVSDRSLGFGNPDSQVQLLVLLADNCSPVSSSSGLRKVSDWRRSDVQLGLEALLPYHKLTVPHSLIITWYLVPSDPPVSKNWKVDFSGAFAIGSALLLLILTLTLAQNLERGWSTPCKITPPSPSRFLTESNLPSLLVGSAVLFAIFGWRQWYLTKATLTPGNKKCPPLIPKGLVSWKKRNLLMIYAGAFFCWAATDVSDTPGQTDVT